MGHGLRRSLPHHRPLQQLIRLFLAATLTAAAFLTLGAGAVWAHRTSVAESEVTLEGADLRYRLTLSPHDMAVALGFPVDLTQPLPDGFFGPLRDLLRDYLVGRLRVSADGGPCVLRNLEADHRASDDRLTVTLDYACGAAITLLRIDYLLFFDIDREHRGPGRLEAGGSSESFLFERSYTTFETAIEPGEPESGPWQRFLDWLRS